MKPGDILAFSGRSLVSRLIELGTYGAISHVGIVGDHGLLFEANLYDREPCSIQGRLLSGTQAHTIESRLGYNGRIWHYPLIAPLYRHERRRLVSFLIDTLGLPYDEIGAFRAGGIGFSWLESLLHPADLTRVFCSEWTCAALTHIGRFKTTNVSRYSPNKFIRRARWQGVLGRPVRLK